MVQIWSFNHFERSDYLFYVVCLFFIYFDSFNDNMLNNKNENKRVWEHQHLPFGDHPINEFGVENQESMDCFLVLAIFIKNIKRLFWEFLLVLQI
jgi:hypothetical protein